MDLILFKFVILYNILLFLDEQTMIHNLHKAAIYPKQEPILRKVDHRSWILNFMTHRKYNTAEPYIA